MVCDVRRYHRFSSSTPRSETGSVPAIAVGDHILLGGDNMDVTLARRVEARLGARLDAAQWSMLAQACRLAKETLLTPGGPDKTRVSVVGRGTRLVGGALSVELSRGEVLEVILDGFFPRTLSTESPTKGAFGTDRQLPMLRSRRSRGTSPLFWGSRAEVAKPWGGARRRGPTPSPPQRFAREWGASSRWSAVVPRKGRWHRSPAALDVAVARSAAACGWCGGGLHYGGTARAYFVSIEAAGRSLSALPHSTASGREAEVGAD
jgi:hypothetical protein